MKNPTISIIGLGYVGLPLSVVFSKKYRVIGYDNNNDRVDQLNNFIDKTNEIESKEIEKCLNENLIITSDLKLIKYADIYIITVPTPIDNNKNPGLKFKKFHFVEAASRTSLVSIFILLKILASSLINAILISL